jgi:hypothetical protein
MAKRNTETLNDLSRCLDPLDKDATLIAVIEMSQSSWLVAGIVPGVERQPLKKIAIDEHALLKLLSRWRKVTRSDALPSRSRPDTTVSAWRAGSLHSASRPTSFMHQVSRSRANTAERGPIGSTRSF